MQYDRPSGRELDKRLEEAKACLKDRKGLFANPAKAVGELYQLAINDAGEIWKLIYELLPRLLLPLSQLVENRYFCTLDNARNYTCFHQAALHF